MAGICGSEGGLTVLTIGLIRASLPSYFPERHGMRDRAEAALGRLCDTLGARLVVVPAIPMDGAGTLDALRTRRVQGVDFVLLLQGGFTKGDVARAIAASEFRAGF